MASGKSQRESTKESQERYVAYIRNSQEGIWRVELKKPILVTLPVSKQIELIHKHAYFAEANVALAKMFGFPSPEPLIGKQLVDVVKAHPNSVPLTTFIKNSYNLTGAETHEKDRQGNDRYFRHNLTGIIENGHLVRAWGTQQDITGQRMALLAQQKSDNRLKLALKASNMGIWEWDVKTNGLFWSDELKLIHGLSPADKITFKKFLALIHPEDLKNVQASVTDALQHKNTAQTEYRILWPDGSTHWVLSVGKAYPETGEASYMMGTCMLIDERKEYESSLLESESRFRCVADSAPILIWRSGLDALCVYFNKPWLDFTGRSLQQELGNGWAEGVHPEDYNRCRKTYQTAFKKRQPFSMEYRLRRRDGVYRWIVDNGAPQFSADGEFMGFIGGCADIEDIKIAIRRAAELEVYNAHLLELNSAKDEFISIASHQLRTPATNVKQYLGMVLDGFVGNVNAEQQEMLRTAYESNDRQIDIINDLLKVAKIDAGKVTLAFAERNIVELIQEVLDEHQTKFNERKQTLNYNYSQKNIPVELDKRMFCMAVENIVDNASKYSPEAAKVAVRVSTKANHVVVTINDTGIGMDKKDQEKLFQKFFRIQNHLTSKIEGTGLGLYWSKKIIDLHGGTLRLQSSLGKGTKFTIRLPIRAEINLN